ncbi:MAG: hypothetical protein R2701_09970 [Acidimicrobiales bacterium]
MPEVSDIATPDSGAAAAPRPLGGFAAPAWWPWGVGVLVGLLVVGPGLGGGSLLSLDLLVTPEMAVPPGVYGLGPALSQRVPLFVLVGWLAAVVGGPVAVKVLLVGWVAAGFAGAARLVRVLEPRAGALAQATAGVLWTAGPFALTRIGVGHINLVWVVAVLPWALPRLCRPGDHLPSTFLASLALAIGGPAGGTLGVLVALVGLGLERSGAKVRTALSALAPQVVWVLPTAVLLWAGAGVSGASSFPTAADGVGGWLGLPAGGGFWRPDLQVGSGGVAAATAGVLVVAASAVGLAEVVARRGWRSWPGAATVSAVLALLLAAASAVPGIASAYDALSLLPIGAPLRESDRFLAVWLVWAAPMASLGARRLALRSRGRRGASRVGLAAPALLVLAVLGASVPSWWGIEGRLSPVRYPRSWSLARDRIADEPGTVLALPWSEYPTISFADGRQAFNPLPQFLGGDVISSYDPGFDPDGHHQEQVDRRALVVDGLVDDLRSGEAIGDRLADLGVRWVVLAHEEFWATYQGLADDVGLRLELAYEDLELYEVIGWAGPAVGPDGGARTLERPIPPVVLTDGEAGTVLGMGGAPGWVQGWGSPARVTGDGRLELTGDGRVVWFWPAALLVAVDVAVFGAAIGCLRSRRRRFVRFLAPGSDARLA